MRSGRLATIAAFGAFLLANAMPASAQCERAAFRIVLDVGHSPESPGATSARGIDEYRFNLSLAAIIEAHLVRQGYAETRQMLSDGGRAGLGLRAAKANALEPNLFLSVHHDSVQKTYLKSWVVDGAEQKFSDRFAGWSLFVSRANGRFRESAAFATVLADRLLDAGLPFTTHHAEAIRGENRRFLDAARGIYRFDELAVLKATEAPAVLMEAGLIINRDEEQRLAGPERQNRIARAVTGAVDAFCALQPPLR
ncbi:N-acetylmuramoyl-L-alanine amidase family protein [Methylobacterium haplocladii]|uniref:N-acetylmuramoyl-L-alanine amidase n=2 Tax=Methylobacterium haplocladii TaxID=1176176 RepID=A0A512IMZ3_9HYPH|nr:N-acetylmuramoyl-L-alanine amidase [Methylobacterium haplocladii]GEO99073.1 N-acetylmuramoyl-L-alanine amidase [Methylobacterium haplocladii]GJD84082.1 N-acetylmuramoyl-L-alanine amidase AmiC [Methylobacterium haplocladii]GLS60072.1 N-acetylmuramoyl-L-alanine amidase [Methylobacterium haplocladii]